MIKREYMIGLQTASKAMGKSKRSMITVKSVTVTSHVTLKLLFTIIT